MSFSCEYAQINRAPNSSTCAPEFNYLSMRVPRMYGKVVPLSGLNGEELLPLRSGEMNPLLWSPSTSATCFLVAFASTSCSHSSISLLRSLICSSSRQSYTHSCPSALTNAMSSVVINKNTSCCWSSITFNMATVANLFGACVCVKIATSRYFNRS